MAIGRKILYKDSGKNNDHNRAKHREYISKNREVNKEYCKKYRKEHAEEAREYFRKHYQEHREEIIRKRKERLKLNPRIYADKAIRRYKREKAVVVRLTVSDIRLLKAAGCFFCGSKDKLTVAHDTPVSKMGNTTRGNTFCLCQSCNSKMKTRSLSEMLIQKELGI